VGPILPVRAMVPGQAASAGPPLPPVPGSPGSAYDARSGRPHGLRLPWRVASRRQAPQEPSGPPPGWTLRSTHTTLLVDPDSPSGRAPPRFLGVGFWGVKPLAVCMSRANGAGSRFRQCGLPCGRRGALGTLRPCRSVRPSVTGATRGRSGGVDLTPPGLAPCKNRQASRGAPTLAVSRARKLQRSVSCGASAPLPDCVKTRCTALL
jgi:hypothetical protein